MVYLIAGGLVLSMIILSIICERKEQEDMEQFFEEVFRKNYEKKIKNN